MHLPLQNTQEYFKKSISNVTFDELTQIQAGLDEMSKNSVDNVLGVVAPILVPEYGRYLY